MSMRSIIYAAVLLCLLASFEKAPRATAASPSATGPTILKRTIEVYNYRFLRYWPNPKAAEPQYNTWSWVPRISFEILGPVPGGSQWLGGFRHADGQAVSS